ncbi:MAG: class D sortase [Oscillospiraceae bacterium]|nr:class D sortase [Oscillospiraceae bacterium]
MKRRLTMLLAVCCLLTALSMPAHAMDYTFDSPPTGDFGTPTSDETIYEHVDPNVDRSKNSALIPPGFGTPTSYLPNSGEFLTPNLAAGGPLNSPALVPGPGSTVSGGSVMLPDMADMSMPSLPGVDMLSTSAQDTFYTELAAESYAYGESLGTLTIPAIGVDAGIVQGTDSAALKKGVGHFTNTSIWDGNVALAAHNRGTNSYFGKIHTLNTGDTITLTTQFGTRTYSVTSVMKIAETDNSMLAATNDNCITLFTCVQNESEYRWCVRAVEV